MKETAIYYTKKNHGSMINAYAEMQMDYISKSYTDPSSIELDLTKRKGEYISTLLFSCSDFSFSVCSRSWSPYKAIENVTLLARDEIMQRTYGSCIYA
jgi:hypothetical protein